MLAASSLVLFPKNAPLMVFIPPFFTDFTVLPSYCPADLLLWPVALDKAGRVGAGAGGYHA